MLLSLVKTAVEVVPLPTTVAEPSSQITVALVMAVGAVIVSVIAAFGTMVVSVYNGIVIKKDGVIKDKKLDEIHVLVNARMTEALAKIAALEVKVGSRDVIIEELRKYISDLRNRDTIQTQADQSVLAAGFAREQEDTRKASDAHDAVKSSRQSSIKPADPK